MPAKSVLQPESPSSRPHRMTGRVGLLPVAPYQRFALQATALSIRQAFTNQPIEVPSLRPQISSYLGLGNRRPDLIVRFGRGPPAPRSLRRPVEAVIDRQ